MKRIIRIMMLLAAMTAAAGEAWARGGGYGKIIYEMGTDGSDGGELFFFASADDASAWTNGLIGQENPGTGFVYNLSEVTLTDGKVYIQAESDGVHTCSGVTFTAGKSGGSDMAQARRYSADDSGVQMNAIEVSAVSGKPGVYCFEMPDDGMNVTISAKFAEKATNTADISYIDADGVTQTKAAGTVYVLDGTEYWLGIEDEDTWYVCNSTLDYKLALAAWGDFHLILADGAKMSVEGEVGIELYDNSLTIYGQSTGKDMGSLTVTGRIEGIGTNESGSVTINGGEVTATGKYGILCGKDVTINGGKVTATDTGEEGYGIISGGDITLGWNSATGYITATSYYIDRTGSVKTADNKVLKYTDDDSQTVTLMGTLDATTIAGIAGKKLTPYGIFGYCGKADVNGGKNVTWEIPIEDDAATTTIDESKTLNIMKNADVTGQTDFSMADYENTNAGNFAPWLKPNAAGNASVGLKYESVTAVNIGEGVTSIGKKAFNSCSGLTSVTIGEDVNTISNQAFMGCSGLTSVNIPASVATIGTGAFSVCDNLTTVTVNRYGSGITTLGDNVFDDRDDPKLILVPDEVAYDEYYGSDGKGWGEYKDKLAPQKLTVAKNASGWSTYCHRFHVSYSVDGATAYAVTGLSEDGKSVSISSALAAVAPATPLLLNYGSTGSVTLTADLTTVTAVEDGDIVSTGEDNCIFSGNTTGSPKKHTADTDDGIPALTGVAGQTSYALYNGNFLRIDTDNGIDGHRCVLTVNGAASPEVIALSTAVVTPGTDGRIGRIVYSKGTGDHGKLIFYKDEGLSLANKLTPGAALNADGLKEVKDDKENVVGYRIYVYAEPDEGYTVNGMTLQAELSTAAQQSRRFDSADTPTLQIGRAIELTPVEGIPYIFEMVMPNDPNINVSVTATFAAKATNTAAIEYIDADGVKKTKAEGTVYVLDGTEEVLGLFTAEEGVWYVCNSTLDYKHVLDAASDVHLILADGATMSVEVPDGRAIDVRLSSLTIYGQSTGKDMGSLTAKGKEIGISALGPGSVTINGGVVTATGKYGIRCVKDVTINGGKVTATGEEGYGIISNGDIILGWNSATGSITATSYDTPGYVKTADGKMLKYTNDNSQTVTLMGTLNATTIAAIARKELTPYGIFGYCGKADVNDGKNVVWEILAEDNAATNNIDESKTLNIMKNADVTGQTDFSMADYENTNASNFAPWLKPDDDGKLSVGLKYESVTAVNIGEGVTSIGQNAFDSCSGLTSVTIGEDVTTIGNNAFIGCSGLTTVNIPASVTTIGGMAFGGCSGLTTVTVNRYDSGITTLGYCVFDDGDYPKLILVPDEAAYDAYYKGSGWGEYKDKLAPQTLKVAKNASGWGTYCHRFPVSYSLSEGATAYTVGGISTDKNGVTTVVAEAASDNLVAAETPLLLGYTGEGSVTLTAVPATAKANDHPSYFLKSTEMNVSTFGNMTDGTLKHTTDDDGIPELTDLSTGWLSYVLVNGVFQLVSVDEGTPGHRWVLRVSRNEIGGAVATTIGINGATTTQPATNLTSIVSGGTLTYYKDDEGQRGKALTAEEALEAGATYYVQCKPDFGFTMKGFSIMAQLAVASSVAQARSLAPQVGAEVTLSAVDDRPGLYSFVMPTGATRLTVSAAFPEKECQTGVSYMTWDGTQQKLVEATTPEGTYVYELDGSETELGQSGTDKDEKPYVTWYMVPATATGVDALSYNGGLTLNGDVRLILADGGSVKFNGNFFDPEPYSMSAFRGDDSQLTVYGQAEGTGELDATTDAVAFSIGALTICGGDVNVNGNTVFSGNSLIVYGGAFTSESTTVNNTSITAKSIEIYGGQVTIDGAIQSAGDIWLGWTDTDDHIQASSYVVSAEGHYVRIAEGKMLKYTGGDNAITTLKPGIVMPAGVTAIAGKELTPYGYFGYCGKADVNDGKNVTWSIVVDDPATTDVDESEILVIEKNPIISGQDVNYDMADYDDNGGPWKELSPVVATIGSGVTAIGANAFAGCDALKLILVPDMTAYDAFAQKVSDADKAKLAPNVMSVAKNASGWSTYCHRFPVSYSAEGATAYTVSGLSTSGENVSVTATTGNLVAPAVPLLLGYTGTEDITLTAAPATATTPPADAIVSYSGTGFTYYGNPSGTANLSTADLTDCVYVYPNTAGQQSYVLNEGAFIMVNGTTGGIAPHRCWLNIAGSNAARALTIGGDETTGVKEREAHKYSPDIYTLDGRKVNGKPTKKGMYINGDRKVVIK